MEHAIDIAPGIIAIAITNTTYYGILLEHYAHLGSFMYIHLMKIIFCIPFIFEKK